MLAETLFAPEVAVIVGLAAAAAVAARLLGAAAPLLFLATGLLVGPVLGLVEGGAAASLLADLGLVFLLFLTGLELTLVRVRPMLRTTLTVTPVQMVVTGAVFYVLASLFLDPVAALVVAAASAYSSTAVVLHMLADRNELDTRAGRLDMGLLLFEDLTVIVVIAAITAGGAATALGGAVGTAALALLAVGGTALVAGRLVLPHLLALAYDRPHAYFIQALGWLFLLIGLSEVVGISHEIGAFFAGLALAQHPGSEELQERVRPLTALFMALFFIGLSVGLDAGTLLMHREAAVVLAVAVLVDKFAVHQVLFRLAGEDRDTALRASINMMQTSEFSIVLGAVAVGAGLVGEPVLGLLTIVALVTMMVSTVLIDLQDRIAGEPAEGGDEAPDAVIAGFGESGPDILAVVAERFDAVTVIDPRLSTRTALAATPHRHVFADVRHPEVRREAGVSDADLVVGLDLVPEAGLDLVRARDGDAIMVAADGETAELYGEAGARLVLDRETLGTGRLVAVVEDALDRGGRDG